MNARKPSGFSWVYLRTRLTPPPQRLLTTAMLNRFQSLLTITTACTCVRHQSWSPRWRVLTPTGAGENGKCVTPDSLNQIALLQVRRHDKLRLLARGPDADAALAAFQALAADNFGESPEAQTAEPAIPARVEGAAMLYPQAPIQPAPRRRRHRPRAAAPAPRSTRRWPISMRSPSWRNTNLTPISRRSSPVITPCSTMKICLMPPTIACSPNSARRNGRGIKC